MNGQSVYSFKATAIEANAQSARLSRGLQRRLIADYEAEDVLTVEHARVARDEAVAFVSSVNGCPARRNALSSVK